MNDTKLETLITEVKLAASFQAGAWSKVIKQARVYAHMKAHGSFVERRGPNNLETVVRICASDRERYEKVFLSNLLFAIEDAFVEDAMLGGRFCPGIDA